MVGILDPLEVKGITLSNRIIMPPMYTGLAMSEGAVTQELIEHYVEHSVALGLVIVEHSYVSTAGKLTSDQLGVHDDHLIPRLQKLAGSIRATGTPVVIQINHAGGKASMKTTGMRPVAPSQTENARELQVEEIEALTESFGNAAERVMKAGFNGVEIHGAHGFLLNQFLSPLTNQREDSYGGSLQKRMVFPLQVVEKVREKVDKGILLYRLGSDDLDPEGIRIEHSQRFATELQKAGVDIVDVSGGLCGSRPPKLQGKQGYFIPQAQQIKDVVDMPVIGIGGIKDPEYADRLVREGRVDLVAVGRTLLKNHRWGLDAIKVLAMK